MSPATATTSAKAVRQHGGGLAHASLPRAALCGRQQCPSGGVKKSLCCAAAGINALDLPATTTRAYPMTGVRPARKPSTSLRSPTRPLAQLVMGYKTSISTPLKQWHQRRYIQKPSALLDSLHSAQYRIYVQFNFEQPSAVHTVVAAEPWYTTLNFPNATPKLDPAKGYFDTREVQITHLGKYLQTLIKTDLKLIEQFSVADILIHTTIKIQRQLTSVSSRRDDFIQRLNPSVLSNLRLQPGLMPSHANGYKNSGHRAHSLHPRRSTLGPPRQKKRTRNQKRSQGRNQQQLRTEREVNSDFIGQHARLLGDLNYLSLPVTCTNVQRGAA